MRLVFINRFYWPETPATGQLLTDLAEELARIGHDVSVITSHPGAPGLPAEELRQAVHIYRHRGTRWSRAGLIGKAADFISFHLGALWLLFRMARRDTTVIAMTDPPLLGIGVWLVAQWRRARVIHWVQDIYPELAIELAGQGWLGILRPLRDLSWRRAAHCVTLGEDMAGILASARVALEKRTIIPNWAPVGLTVQPRDNASALRTRWGLLGKFVVAYSGNLGRVHDLEPVLAVADALRGDENIAFIFIGAGAQFETLTNEARRRGLPNVSFRPPQSRAELAATLAMADLQLVTLRPGCERLVFPSKLYGIAAVGRPMLFIGPANCEVASLARQHGLGDAAERDDIPGIAEHVRRMQQDEREWARRAAAAARFAEAHNFPSAASRWSQLLHSMVHSRPVSRTTTAPAAP